MYHILQFIHLFLSLYLFLSEFEIKANIAFHYFILYPIFRVKIFVLNNTGFIIRLLNVGTTHQ